MASPRLSLLSDQERESLHEKTLRVLERVGIAFNSLGAIDLLEEAGAIVDRSSLRAKIPPELVELALRKAPRSLLLAARDPAKDLRIDDGTGLVCTTDGQASLVMDEVTGDVHEATRADLVRYFGLFDALPEIDYIWTSLSSRELDPLSAGLETDLLALASCSKHVQSVVAHDPAEVPVLLEMLEAIAGCSLKKRPIYSSLSCPLSPLQFEGAKLDASLELARHGVPIVVVPVPQLGTTGPMSVFGTAIVNMAELLAAVVVYQLAAPGCQVCSCVGAAVGDMRTGSYLCGTPEVALLNLACIEMSRFYGLPSMGSGITSDAKATNFQAGAEGMLTGMTIALAGADVLLSAGLLDGAQILTPAKVILDCDSLGAIRRFLRGMSTADADALLDDVEDVGIGGHFLSRRTTRARWQAGEVWRPSIFQRGSFAEYDGRPLLAQAQERAESLCAEYRTDALPDDVQRHLQDLLVSWRSTASGGEG